jgi:hypothetical protein
VVAEHNDEVVVEATEEFLEIKAPQLFNGTFVVPDIEEAEGQES